MSMNTCNVACIRHLPRIMAYMTKTWENTLSRIAHTRSFGPRWYLDTPFIYPPLLLQPDMSLNFPISSAKAYTGILLVLLVYLRVDFYMRHPNATGRFLREATGCGNRYFTDSIIPFTKTGKSAGVREVIILPSITSSLST
jgi:hypothetical protein